MLFIILLLTNLKLHLQANFTFHTHLFTILMKKRLLLLLIMGLSWTVSRAQLPPGATAPNITFNDLANGYGQITLYELLDQGKTVYLDFFATWCGPCWNYHNTHALRDIWEQYGPGGTDEAYVVGVESDPSTNTNCIFGSSGCNSTTQGNWTAGTPYPISDNPEGNGLFNINYYPTIYMVCPGPDRKIYETGQLNKTGLWNKRNTLCDLNVSAQPATINNVICFGTNTGSVSVQASGGTPPYSYHWSTGANNSTGVLNNVPAGTYSVTVTAANSTTAVVSGMIVEGPSAPISVALIESTSPGCNGITGSALIEASGGWPGNYSYVWNNGQSGEELLNITPGTYTVSVTDDQGCVKTQSFTFAQTPPPTVVIVPPPAITCASPTIQINASGSSSGGDITYNWFASNGGHIVSGGNTPTPVVDAAGTYTLQIVNNVSTCSAFGSTSVNANLTAPTSNAGAAFAISCSQPTATLQGSGSGGNNLAYLWTASNGGNIVSGAGTLTPVVNASGTYTLRVTNPANGCTATSTTTVTGSSTSVSAVATGGALTCTAPSVTLNVTTSGSGVSYEWTGPNNFSSQAQSPVVATAGEYTVVVSDPGSGCTGSVSAIVAANNALPGAAATGGTLACNNPAVVLAGSTPALNTVYQWTGPNNFTSVLQNPTVTDPGAYELIVTDTLNGCASSATATVNQNIAVPTASAVASTNLNCNNAEIQINGTASSQGANFSYEWSGGNIVSGNNTLTPVVNAAATYNLLVTNQLNGCTSTTSVTVNQSTPVTATASVQSVLCNGGTNGTASTTAGGGNGNYSYLWSNGATTSTIENLTAGTYGLVVTDGEGCTAIASAVVTQPDVLLANATATAQSANGVNDGTATSSPSGGTAGYTYVWSNNETTATITNLAPGTYAVSVTDGNGCVSVEVVTVNSFNCTIAATVVTSNVSCFGGNNGSAAISLAGANDPVTFAWSNGSSTQEVSDLTAGTYTVQILDGNNCPASLNVNISQPLQLAANATTTPESESGANDGTATANPVGGTSPYTYLWNNGETTAQITNLAPGTYSVAVTDANGCVTNQTVTVNSFDCTIATQFSVVDITCNGNSNGSATVVLNGGTAPFIYAWSNGGSTPTISGISAGTYAVSITDENGCVVEANVTVNEPSALTAEVTSVLNTICPADPVGAINTSTAGGTQGYSYLWSTGATTANLAGLVAGAYTMVVTDANGCTQSVSASVTSNDTEAPALSVNNPQIQLNANGTVTLTPGMLGVVATDNCAVVSTSMSVTNFDCDDIGSHDVVISVTDGSGNTTTAVSTVTIVDKTAPVVTCPASITRCSYDNIVSFDNPTATDNCLLNGGTWEQTAGLPSGSEFPFGATTETFSYTDASGNTGTCSFDVIITDPVALSTAVTNATNGQSNGSIDLTVTGGNAPYTYAWTQNDQPFSTEEDLNNIPAGVYQVIVKDASGCEYHTETITVENTVNTNEPTWASAISMRPNPTKGTTYLVFGEIPKNSVQIVVTDATGRIVSDLVSDGVQQVQLNLNNMPSGMYYVRISSNDYTTGKKLVVNR